ncbi:MAG: nucleoside phosphorylase [Spirochaetota bacterium]
MEFHIHCNPENIARYVFTPGDPERARKIAGRLEEARLISESRGYLVFTGSLKGFPMTVCATNMGGPTTAIALEELGHMGADTFIRIGSCGTLQDDITCGDVIIATGTYRGGGTSLAYLPMAFPAVADFSLTQALVQSAELSGLPYRLGLGIARDAFYGPQDPHLRDTLAGAGILSAEMESDTLFILASLRGWRAGAIYACDGTAAEVKPEWGAEAFRQGEKAAIEIALKAMLVIVASDAGRQESRSRP